MVKDLAVRARMHKEEAATQFPLSLPPTPPPRASRPALFEHLTYSLVESEGFERLKEVDEGVFLNEFIHLIGQGDSHHSFLRALGAWMTRDVSTEDDVGDGNGHSLAAMKELCHEAKRVPRDISFWSKTIHSTWTYMKNSREWDEYEVQSKAVGDAIFEKRKAYMREQVAAYEHSVQIDREAVRWDFNALFHYCGINSILRSILPPLPWSHSEEEAREVLRPLMTVTFMKPSVPSEARLLKLFFVSNGRTDM
jgi:hypothetical protein